MGKEKRGTVQMQLFARIDPDTETFVEVGFRSHGCLAAIGCAAALAERLRGMTFEQALAITKEELDERLGGLPSSRRYTLLYGTEAVRALIGDYCLRVKGFSLAQLNDYIPCDYMCANCLLTVKLLPARRARRPGDEGAGRDPIAGAPPRRAPCQLLPRSARTVQ